MIKDYQHTQTAHCENGVVTGLLKHKGLDFLTEPLAFGLGSGILYIHIPFLKVNGGPAISFRTLPGAIFNRTCKALEIDLVRKKFTNVEKAQAFLDQKLAEGTPVGSQVGVFHLSYFPKEYRFHFNAHNIIVYAKDGDTYNISDPVMEEVTTLTVDELNKVRFAQGVLAPKGHLYYPKGDQLSVDKATIQKGIIKGIKRSVNDMLHIPGPVIGTRGMGYTANKIIKLRDKLGPKRAGLFLGQIVRMQEEIGTGGGGFRFLYAAFLEEASEYLQDERLIPIADQITKAGDLWRNSAMQMAGIYKGRITEQKDFVESANMMREIAALEKEAFTKLGKLKLKY